MTWWHFSALALLFFLQGCIFNKTANLYEVKLKSGLVLYAQGQPQKDTDGFYHFADVNDQAYSVENQSVLYIKPVQFKK